MTTKICPICEQGHLSDQEEIIHVEHMGQQGSITSQFSTCDVCGSEQATPANARFNKRAMIAFKKQVQGLLTGMEVRELRKGWNFSQEDAAKVFGGGPVAFSKYESDDVMQSEAMDRLIRIARDVPASLDKLMADAGVKRKIDADWTTVAVVNFHEKSNIKRTHVVYQHEFGLEANYGY
ncbi:type II toxin-antitoxin system MqsA family antitoxin [Photobacterium damselae]|uniref:type II toxin-antitoxin system MqsA family antitoxin n=1 Tax=Gammaproteobacteria TaxID=1236 RepID=UPI001EDEC197|nr:MULTISPECIES: type II toxin-antitoxin system MqsA family antitoxin [Gammaproteobacteria]MCG3813850.1 type II toxin-antitoxin system MqsA family antitoxin [Photobacterium damselae]MCG3880538.1 type II toxin-antitoxin system MqsA family antitoxin [Psychrobacter sp. Ps6]